MRTVAILIIAALLAGCAAARIVETPPPVDLRATREAETLAALRALGRNGDWLVTRGYHATDNTVAWLTNKPFSHAAVLDLERDGVVEAEAIGVHTSSLEAFVRKSHRVLLVRPVWSDGESAEAAVRKARAAVGRPYDFLGLIGVGIPEAYYCSELAVEVYRARIRPDDRVPRPVEPGQLPYWGRVLYDSGPT